MEDALIGLLVLAAKDALTKSTLTPAQYQACVAFLVDAPNEAYYAVGWRSPRHRARA